MNRNYTFYIIKNTVLKANLIPCNLQIILWSHQNVHIASDIDLIFEEVL